MLDTQSMIPQNMAFDIFSEPKTLPALCLGTVIYTAVILSRPTLKCFRKTTFFYVKSTQGFREAP